jgi:hypothetical protein
MIPKRRFFGGCCQIALGREGRIEGKAEPMFVCRRGTESANAIVISLLRTESMGQLVVRNLEDGVKERLQRRAVRHGRSMEEEVRHILRDVSKEDSGGGRKLGSSIAPRFRTNGLTGDLPEFHGDAPRPARFSGQRERVGE